MQNINTEIFHKNKWDILQEIAKKPQSATELSETLGTSISNLTQQLKLLEAYGVIKKIAGKEESSVGKPRTIYSLGADMAYNIILMDKKAEIKQMATDEYGRLLINMLSCLSPEDIFYLLKFKIKYEDVFKKCKAIGVLKTTKDAIELLLITDSLDEIRSKFSNIFIENFHGKTKKIINWTHSEYEIDEGLKRKDKYFIDMLKNCQTVFDPQNILDREKQKREEI
jgi:DNA-binding Lrp family transcriptional regulator